ncbi:TPA: HAD family phosphatase [bacterium]|nr:HAD family phosphatase [bacterium]
MTKIKAIIFDMDGVLIEAKEWHYEALNKALGLFGMEISRFDHVSTYDGLPTSKKLDMLSIERGLPRALHNFISDMKQIYTIEFIHTKCRPVFHHQYALARLLREGYTLVVCSNAVKNSVELMLNKARIIEHFKFILSNQDITKAKPDPEIYLTAMERLKLNPSECLILEDNNNGVKAALASGAHLLKIHSINDVNYENIRNRINEIERENND